MSPNEIALRAVIGALRIAPGGRLRWLGREVPDIPLVTLLYDHFATQARPVPAHPLPPEVSTTPGRLAEPLVAACHSRVSRQPGWRLVGRDGDGVVIERDGIRVWADPAEVLAPRRAPLDAGAPVTALVPAARPREQYGFVVLLGADAPADDPRDGIDRVYLNIDPAGAPALAEALTAALDAWRIPFHLKLADDPSGYSRVDPVVLYAPRGRRPQVAQSVRSVVRDVAPYMRPATPPFTLPLACGVALAEDPPGGQSFGVHRCTLIAQALEAAARDGVTDDEGRLAAVVARFAEEGISLHAAHRAGVWTHDT